MSKQQEIKDDQAKEIKKAIGTVMYLANNWKEATENTPFDKFKCAERANMLLNECEKAEKQLTEVNKQHEFYTDAMNQMQGIYTMYHEIISAVYDTWQSNRDQLVKTVQYKVKVFLDVAKPLKDESIGNNDKKFLEGLQALLDASRSETMTYNKMIGRMHEELDKELEEVVNKFKLANPDLKA
jgi:putative protein kinase ArgK-like GTPase of G3E family